MSLLAALAKRWNYSVKNPGGGRVLYREGNREYVFPIFQENGEIVLVSEPSSQRIHLFFNSCAEPREFSIATRDRILPRIVEHLRDAGTNVRVFHRPEQGDFVFYPELFDSRNRAIELLEAAGLHWFSNYASIDLLHGEYGLEIGGIQNEADVAIIADALQRGFPHWHHQNACVYDHGREPGWSVALCMFPVVV